MTLIQAAGIKQATVTEVLTVEPINFNSDYMHSKKNKPVLYINT